MNQEEKLEELSKKIDLILSILTDKKFISSQEIKINIPN